jgi:hypothetical protein
MRKKTRKWGPAQSCQDKCTVLVDGDARIAAMKSDGLAGAGVIAGPGKTPIRRNVHTFTYKKGNETHRITGGEEQVIIQRAFHNENFSLCSLTWIYPEIGAELKNMGWMIIALCRDID